MPFVCFYFAWTMNDADSGSYTEAAQDGSRLEGEDHLIACDIAFAGVGAASDHRHAPRVIAIHGSAACKTVKHVHNTAKEQKGLLKVSYLDARLQSLGFEIKITAPVADCHCYWLQLEELSERAALWPLLRG